MLWFFFGHEACGILAPQPGIQPAPTALEGEVLTSVQPVRSLSQEATFSRDLTKIKE